ncbi:endo-1,4-beta-xylanase [uncultured Draconibacterium sp.]|uniref:endo-1,4-beta-xylanase n=1 Tax=uncultured Draconibacterium sp. TaxID=1573823 RepID=UPI002AA70143|nr:endo-1,4-beta-xylanase [uncultured Draconibacterium sp.]
MKYINKLLLGAVAVFFMASCVEDSLLDYRVDKPGSVVQQEYLNEYDVLKSYVDRSASPDFKLGAGVSLNAFNEKGLVYSHISSNFDEVTAGYAMKHGAIVQDNGSMDFAGVEKFVAAAEEAGVTIYGHTLAWHANQNAEYLNGIIAPIKIPGTGGPSWEVLTEIDFEDDDASNYSLAGADATFSDHDGGRALSIVNPSKTENDWNVQLFVTFPQETVEGQQYRLTMDVKAANDGVSYPTQAHRSPGAYKHWNFFGSISPTTEWSEIVVETMIDASTSECTTIAFNLGHNVTTYEFDNIKVEWLNPEGSGPSWDVVSENNFESDNASNYQGNSNAIMSFTADGTGAEGNGRALKIVNESVRANDWDCQFFFTFPEATEVGQKYILEMDVRADADVSVPTQAHTVPYAYKHWDFFGQVAFTSEWTHFVKETVIADNTSGCTTIAFNLGANATNYYFDNIVVKWYNEEGGGQIIEMTPEEKQDTITSELDRWIAGMMEVSKDYVHAWDVVNEPMDDGNPYELKTGIGNDNLPADHFYWQDYLGKDYAVEAFNMAVQYGSAEDKLFINDYNLEYNLDKCKGLIAYVEYIESKGARVDGIGTQMHINTGSDKDKIVEMFQLLAASGKLIKISELDIGIAGGVKTTEATEEDLQAQAEMYQFVVEKYLELIPANQQYGITAWSPLDSPDDSSWRAGEPIGLWNEGYYRKPAYAGFADGLSVE